MKNIFDKVANLKLDIIDIHNLSCNQELIKKAKTVVDSEICDSFAKNPYTCIQKESSAVIKVLIGELEKTV